MPFRHRIRNSNPGGLRPSTLPLGHWGSPQYLIFTSERGRDILFLWNLEGQSGVRTRDLRLSKQAAALTTAPAPPPPPHTHTHWLTNTRSGRPAALTSLPVRARLPSSLSSLAKDPTALSSLQYTQDFVCDRANQVLFLNILKHITSYLTRLVTRLQQDRIS